MKDEAQQLLEKSGRALHAASVLMDANEPDFAVGRAYYAMLYAAEALLLERGTRFGKHAAVHAAFGAHFAKTGVLDPKYHRWLLDAYDKRREGDYGAAGALSREDAQAVIAQAKEFVAAVRAQLGTV